MNQRIGSTLNTNKMFFPRIFFFSLKFLAPYLIPFISDTTPPLPPLIPFSSAPTLPPSCPKKRKPWLREPRYGSFPFFFVDVGYVRWIGFTQCIFVQYDVVAELDSNVFIQQNKIFLDQYVLKFLDFFFRFLNPYHFLLIFLLSYAISCTLVGILCALLCSVNFLCLWVISDRLMMMFNLIHYRNIAVSLWLMVLPKLSIMSSLYIQLNLFFLYSFQPYHFLLIFFTVICHILYACGYFLCFVVLC